MQGCRQSQKAMNLGRSSWHGSQEKSSWCRNRGRAYWHEPLRRNGNGRPRRSGPWCRDLGWWATRAGAGADQGAGAGRVSRGGTPLQTDVSRVACVRAELPSQQLQGWSSLGTTREGGASLGIGLCERGAFLDQAGGGASLGADLGEGEAPCKPSIDGGGAPPWSRHLRYSSSWCGFPYFPAHCRPLSLG